VAGEQTGIGEPAQRYIKLMPICYLIEQFIRKFAAEHGTDLRDLFGRWPEPVKPRGQRGMQRRRDRQLRPGAGGEDRSNARLLMAAFEHGLSQLLKKQWDAVGAFHNLRHERRFERGMTR